MTINVRSMEPDRIVPDCFTFYLLSQYPLPCSLVVLY